ncbi:MAG: 50S ribosomal protein L29 [Acidimicrobiia bacterium]|nr:50S ribosomal protein L29 [Acidimicrobiia bacterium]
MVDEELLNKLAEAKQELFNLRFQHVTGQLDNYARLGQMKKEVARINTILRDREIAAAEAIEGAEAAADAAAAAAAAGPETAQAAGAVSSAEAEEPTGA